MVQTARARRPRDASSLADEMSGYFREMCDTLEHRRMMRSCGPPSRAIIEASKAIWKAMEAAGDLYLDRYEGWYSVRDEAFYDESELIDGEGGEKLSPQGTPVEWTVEETWFFRLSKYQEPLARPLSRQSRLHPPGKPPQRSACASSRAGSRTSASRAPASTGACRCRASPGHVMYVWVDALTTYMTGVGYPDDAEQCGALLARRRPSDRQGHRPLPRRLLAGLPDVARSLPLPKQVFGHGFLLSRGEKMSKSVGNVVDPMALAERFGVDAAALFPAARSHVRPGRQLQRRSDRQPRQCRAGEQLRQSRAAHLVDDFQEFGRRSSRGRAKPPKT